MTDGCDISSEIAPIWTSLDLSDDKSTLVKVMAWCRQATSHYLNQCWPKSLPPYGITRPQWVNKLRSRQNGHYFVKCSFKFIFWIKIVFHFPLVLFLRICLTISQHWFRLRLGVKQAPRADSKLSPGQWETSLQSNAVSHWLGANLEWALGS